MSNFMTDALNTLRQCGLVSVCVINGPALGGGAELSTTCDFRVIANSSKSFVQFVHAKIGASPGWGGARRLTAIVGRKEAIRLCAGSVPLTADDALRIGFADKIVDAPGDGPLLSDADLEAAGLAFLQPFLSQPYPGSVRAIKTAIGAVEDQGVEQSKAVEVAAFEQRWFGPDNVQALKFK